MREIFRKQILRRRSKLRVFLFGFFFVFGGDDGGDGLEVVVFVEVDEFDALGVAAGFADAFDGDADHLAFVGDEHDFVGFADAEGAGDAAGFFGGFHGDDAFAAA